MGNGVNGIGNLLNSSVPLRHVVQFCAMVVVVVTTGVTYADGFDDRISRLELFMPAHGALDMHIGARDRFQLVADEVDGAVERIGKVQSDTRQIKLRQEHQTERFDDYREDAEENFDELNQSLRDLQRSIDAALRGDVLRGER